MPPVTDWRCTAIVIPVSTAAVISVCAITLAVISGCQLTTNHKAPATNPTCTLLDKEGAPAAFNSLATMAAIGMADKSEAETDAAAKSWRTQTEAELNVCPQYRDAYHTWLDPSVRP